MPDLIKPASTKDEVYGTETYVTRWEGMSAEKSDGEKAEVRALRGRTLQAIGEFGTGTIEIEGSLNGQDWAYIDDIDGPMISTFEPDVRFIRPRLLTPSKETKVTLILQQRRLS